MRPRLYVSGFVAFLTVHTYPNPTIQLPWQHGTWVSDFRTFTSLFSKVCSYKRAHAFGFVAFSKQIVLKSLLRCAFSTDTCGRKVQPQKNVCRYKRIRIRVHRTLLFNNSWSDNYFILSLVCLVWEIPLSFFFVHKG